METSPTLPAGEKQYVGGYVPKRLLGHLALYSAHTNISRASLIESFLVRTLEKAPSVDLLCKALAERAIDNWRKDRQGGIAVKWDTFIRRTTRSLSRKKIPEPYIKNILVMIERMKSS